MGERALAFGVGLWLLGSLPGCFGQHNDCLGDAADFGKNPGEGVVVGPDHWESSPFTGPWLPFPQKRIWNMDVTSTLGAREFFQITPYISANSDPQAINDNFTIGSGNLAQISNATEGHFAIQNGTCADYFIRVIVDMIPPAGAAP